MARRLACVLTAAAWLAGGAALAQPAAETAAGEGAVAPLVVEAGRAAETIPDQAQSFVQAYAAAADPRIDQISRWRGAVCVRVVGLPRPDQGARIKARIEAKAASLGLPAAREGCSPNVLIAFTDDPQGEIDLVAKQRAQLLGFHYRTGAQALKTVTHPIQAWYVTATRSNGASTAGAVAAGLKYDGVEQDTEVVDDPDNPPPAGCVSRLTAYYTSAFRSVLIVADNRRLAGVKLGAVADDMLMLTLSQPRSLDGCNALPSVLDRFAAAPCPGREAPDGLTAADEAYLAALYAADLGGRKTAEQNDIAGRMARQLASKADAGGVSPAPGR